MSDVAAPAGSGTKPPASPVVGQFVGLPLGQLICQPIIEVAKGQAELCKVYLDYVMKLAYKDGDPEGEVNVISFDLERPVTNGEGSIENQSVTVKAPLLSLVPVPAFVMDEATVQFTMEVKQQSSETDSKETTGKFDAGFSFWKFKASISGSVTTKSSHTRSTDQTAKYDIYARAVQQPPAEGMARLTALFASIIEPIDAGTVKKLDGAQ
jgi:hypothetical protein